MRPDFSGGLDHIHVYVTSREEAAEWYQQHLGFEINQEMAFWANDRHGPLTIENPAGSIHLALFEASTPKPVSIAFGTNCEEYLHWKQYLEGKNIPVAERDHTISWSLYVSDPYGNGIEITTYDHDQISAHQ